MVVAVFPCVLTFLVPRPARQLICQLQGKQEIKEKIDISGFEIEFKICQVMISRPWFNPDFLAYKNWRFSPGAGFGEVSDGNKIPSNNGMIPNYPVAAYFVSDVKLKMNEFTKESSQVRKFVKAGEGISIGPIRIGGHGGRKEFHQNVSVDEKAGSVAVDGLQLVALRCQAVPKSPDPDPDPEISSWI